MRHARRAPTVGLGLALFAAAVVAMGSGVSCAPSSTVPSVELGGRRQAESNIARGDYAGSATCTPCHQDIARALAQSPMHRMTRSAEAGQVRAPFDGTTVRVGGDEVTVEDPGGEHRMRIHPADGADRSYRVTKVIGGRVREDYAGVEVDASGARVLGSTEKILPLSYVYGTKEWRYKGYSVMLPERTHASVGPSWASTCILCHNTAPLAVSLYDDLATKPLIYQGSVSVLLPEARRARWSVTDPEAANELFSGELELLGGRGKGSLEETLEHAARATSQHFGEDQLVELGIGCEACHNGQRAHAKDPSIEATFTTRSPAIAETVGDGAFDTPAARQNRVCARCHTVLFSQYEYTWEGGTRTHAPGGSTINSGEARDLLLGGCAGALTCTACHDPHGMDDKAKLARLGTPAGNAVCTGCHETLATDEAVRTHSHHDPRGEGGACLACHMPKKNMGLDYDVTRYHRIGSPNDPARVLGDRPLECALCHVDDTPEKLVSTMERWWGGTYDRRALTALYPEADASCLRQTITVGKPHEQAAAAATLGARGTPADAVLLGSLLEHRYPLVRYFAREAIRRLATQSAAKAP